MKKELFDGKHQRKWEVAAAAALLALLVIWGLALQTTEADHEATAARKRMFAVAKVVEVLEDNAAPDTWTEGRRIGEQLLKVQLCSGPYQGEVLTTYNYINAYVNVDAPVGGRIIVRLDLDEQEQPYIISIPSHDRTPMLLGLIGVFAALLVLIGRKRGVMALLGLGYTLACIWYILVPTVLRGANPIVVTVLIVALTTIASLLLITGFSRKTLCAALGCVGGTAVAGLFAAVAGRVSPINGFNMSEAEELVLRSTQADIQISGLLVSGILIASLGAVMDVAMSIASACNELRMLNPNLPAKDLFRSGMNIGRDAMGTMANTLILAFAGASLNTLLLLQIYDYPLIQVINTDAVVIEVIRGMAGSIGIILTVPLVAALSARLFPQVKKK